MVDGYGSTRATSGQNYDEIDDGFSDVEDYSYGSPTCPQTHAGTSGQISVHVININI